jgi:hypothetical protein
MYYKYRFICNDKQDFLYKSKFAGVREGEITEKRLNEWFHSDRPEESLVGSDCVWVVDSLGRLYCYGETYANRFLKYVKDITSCELNLGGL